MKLKKSLFWVKEPDTEECIWYDSMYKKFWKIQNYSERKQIRNCQALGRGGKRWRGTGIFGGDRNVLYLECGRGYTTANICQDILFYT